LALFSVSVSRLRESYAINFGKVSVSLTGWGLCCQHMPQLRAPWQIAVALSSSEGEECAVRCDSRWKGLESKALVTL